MYGMINNYLKALITKEYGEDVWTQITRKIKIEDDGFIEMMVYDDDLTYHIVQAAVDICSITAEDFLEKAGYGWVSHTNKGSYSTFYKCTLQWKGSSTH